MTKFAKIHRIIPAAAGRAMAVAAFAAAVTGAVVSCSTEEHNITTRQGYIDVRVSLQPDPLAEKYHPSLPTSSAPTTPSTSSTLQEKIFVSDFTV